MQNNSHYIAALIKRQWIRKELVESDLFTIDVLDEEFTGGYKPMVLKMGTFRDFILEELSFISLPDTPNTYVGSAGYMAVVNGTENGIEFIPQPTIPVVTPLYEARMTFNGSSNPTVTILHINDLGVTVTWTRTAVGNFRAAFSTPVDPTKLVGRIDNSSTGTFFTTTYDANYIDFVHRDFTGVVADLTSLLSLEIKLYP